MRTRREFISTATVTLLLIPVYACSSGSSGSGSCSGFESTSNVIDMHMHTVCVLSSDLSNPPAAGVTYTTSSAGNPAHMHQIMLALADLQTIQSGGTVTVMTTTVQDHMHMFTIMKG